MFQVSDWSVLVLHFYGNVWNWIPKVIWPRKVILGSFVGKRLLRWLHICMDWILQQSFNFFSFDVLFSSIFFRCLVWGVFGSVLQKKLYFLAVGICDNDWSILGMQCNFTFYLFASSSLLFLQVVVNLFDYFWKPHILFSRFCVNCLLMFYFLYCNNFVSNDVNGACWCTRSLVALCVPDMCFWPAKTGKKLQLLRCIHFLDLVLNFCSDIKGNWIQYSLAS